MFAGQGGHATLDPMYITIYVVKSVELRGGGVKTQNIVEFNL